MSADPIAEAAALVVADVAAASAARSAGDITDANADMAMAEAAQAKLTEAEAAFLLQNAPPLVLPEGVIMPVTCARCGLRFAEPLHGQACPNCGSPVA